MNRKIIGVTVGTSISPDRLRDKMNLQESINDALAQAKESGEFDGQKGDTGERGYGYVASVSRPSWTESQWATYGEVGHVEMWSNSAAAEVRNGCRVGDIFTVVGTATDTGNAHIAYYRSQSDSGDLYGNCIAHSIALRGATGAAGAAGSDASVTATNIAAALGYTPVSPTALNKKANDYSIELYNGTSGNPKPVRFASFNYSTCNSENGIAAKISMVSGHGNGSSYAFLQDAIIKVTFQGSVSVDNFKWYGASAGTYDGAARQYGDIFWLTDETNKIIDFYCLMGQYARMYQTPWRRLTYSTGGAVTQHTSCTVYSSGEKTWGNNSEIALAGDTSTGGTSVTPEMIAAALGYTPANGANYLPLIGGTVNGSLTVSEKIIQGSPSTHDSVKSMNRFKSDLFIEGDGSAPNNPKVAGFYLGRSETDENRHLDIVSGADYSYIDFNKASSANDFTARILVNVTDGNTIFTWGDNATNRAFNVLGVLQQNGQNVVLSSHLASYHHDGNNVRSALVSSDTTPATNGYINWTYK